MSKFLLSKHIWSVIIQGAYYSFPYKHTKVESLIARHVFTNYVFYVRARSESAGFIQLANQLSDVSENFVAHMTSRRSTILSQF